MKARVHVFLKEGVLDPQGKAVQVALQNMGHAEVKSVRQGKFFDLEMEGVEPAEAEARLRGYCEKLLANTVIENFRVEVL